MANIPYNENELQPNDNNRVERKYYKCTIEQYDRAIKDPYSFYLVNYGDIGYRLYLGEKELINNKDIANFLNNVNITGELYINGKSITSIIEEANKNTEVIFSITADGLLNVKRNIKKENK